MSPDSEVNLWNILKKNIGKDLTKVAMPVSINQPLSALQRIAEDLEYSELLDEASQLSGVERMIKGLFQSFFQKNFSIFFSIFLFFGINSETNYSLRFCTINICKGFASTWSKTI